MIVKKLFWTLLIALLAWTGAPAVQTGDSFESVIAKLGEPQSEATIRGTRQLFYAGGVVELQDDKVSYIDPGFRQRALQRTDQAAYEAEQRAKGLVLYEGRWVHPRKRDALEQRKAAQAQPQQPPRQAQAAPAAPSRCRTAAPAAAAAPSPSHDRVREIRDGGKRVDLASVLVPGKVTVVDFFADWCGPCRTLSPHLTKLAADDPDIHVVKIDIVNWNSEVSRQHNVRSIPDVRVFNSAGRQVGSSTSDLRRITRYAQRAKR